MHLRALRPYRGQTDDCVRSLHSQDNGQGAPHRRHGVRYQRAKPYGEQSEQEDGVRVAQGLRFGRWYRTDGLGWCICLFGFLGGRGRGCYHPPA